MENVLSLKDKRGKADSIDKAIGVLVLLILISAFAPVALPGLFNASAFTGVPTWVTTVLGSLGAVAFVLVIYKATK